MEGSKAKNVPKLSSCDSDSDSYAAHSNTDSAKHRLSNNFDSVVRTRSDNQKTARMKGIHNIDKSRKNLSDELDQRKECKNNDRNLKLEGATGIDERTRKEKPGTSNQIVNASNRCIDNLVTSTSKRKHSNYSQISVIRTPIIRNYWVIRRRWTVPTYFSIIYCNKITNYSNFDYPKNSIFRSDSSVQIKEVAIKLPFKIRRVQKSSMVIMISLFGRVRFTHLSDLANKVATGN